MGRAGPFLEDVAQPCLVDGAEVEHALGGGIAPGPVRLEVEEGDLPQVACVRVGAGVQDPGPLEDPTQVTKQRLGLRVVLHAAGAADTLDVEPADRGGSDQALDQDPHLGRVQRRRGLVPALKGVEHLDPHEIGEPGHGELVGTKPRVLGLHPLVHVCLGQGADGALEPEAAVVEVAQAPIVDALSGTAHDSAGIEAAKRAGPTEELLEGLAPRSPVRPSVVVLMAQAIAEEVPLAARDGADPPRQSQGAASPRLPLEGLVGEASDRLGSPTGLAAGVAPPGRGRAGGCPAWPGQGPLVVEITREQPALVVPLARTPAGVDMGDEPLPPPRLAAGAGGGAHQPQRRCSHRHCLPEATASTARRQSSSRACKYTVVEASEAWPSSRWTTSRSTPARTQLVAAVWRSMCGRTGNPHSAASRSKKPLADR